MKRESAYDVARRTAFPDTDSAPLSGDDTVEARIRRSSCLILAAMPGSLGAAGVGVAMSRHGVSDGAFPLGVGAAVVAVLLLLLGLRSRLVVTSDGVTVNFFGIRSRTVRFADLQAATFGMTFPSISFGVTLKNRLGTRVVVHANWWTNERAVLTLVSRRLLAHDVPMDRDTAGLVARTIRVKRPEARIVHRALLRKDRTW